MLCLKFWRYCVKRTPLSANVSEKFLLKLKCMFYSILKCQLGRIFAKHITKCFFNLRKLKVLTNYQENSIDLIEYLSFQLQGEWVMVQTYGYSLTSTKLQPILAVIYWLDFCCKAAPLAIKFLKVQVVVYCHSLLLAGPTSSNLLLKCTATTANGAISILPASVLPSRCLVVLCAFLFS